MLNFLRQKAGLRGAIGVVAAYALALQMLLAGLAGAQMVAADPAGQHTICYTAETGSNADTGTPLPGSQPVHHTTCVVCGAAPLTPPLPDAASPVVLRSSVAANYRLRVGEPQTAARRHEPKSAQGPPQTV